MNTLLLAIGALAPVCALLLVCAYLLRRTRPAQTFREIVVCFSLGMLCVVLALVFALPLDHYTLQFADNSLILGVYDAFIVAAFPEELARYCALRWRFGQSRNFLTSRRSLLLGAVVGLGFAAIENVGYCTWRGWSAVWERSITSVPLHALDGAIIGYAVGYSLSRRQLRWSFLAVAATVILHGVNNFQFRLWYADSSPTEGIGAILVTGWPSNIGVVLVLIGIVLRLAFRRPFRSTPDLIETRSDTRGLN